MLVRLYHFPIEPTFFPLFAKRPLTEQFHIFRIFLYTFRYYLHRSQYPYPIASAGIQLGIVSLILAMYSILWHYVSPYQHASSQHEATTTMDTIIMSQSRIRSWIFGPGFIYKIQWTAPIGLLFGLKYGVTNLGLAMLPAPTHLLLQSTDLIWTCVAAWFIKDERLSPVGYACIAACVVGSAITSLSAAASTASNHDMWNSSRDTNMTTTTTTTTSTSIPPMFQFYENTMWAILINLLSPMLLGLCIAALRVSCKRLLIPCNPNLGGTTMDSSELTCWKLFVSAIVALLLVSIHALLEFNSSQKSNLNIPTNHPFHIYMQNQNVLNISCLLLNSFHFFLLVFPGVSNGRSQVYSPRKCSCSSRG